MQEPVLSGIRVLDLSRVLAGPWCTQMLADMGAEVIKVESEHGDDTRGWGPPFVGKDQTAAYFHCANRGKKSIIVDFTTAKGQDIIHELVKISDIVVENFKLGGLKKYKMDYQSLSAINPKIIYCSITGFGHTGPFAPRAGYDYIIQGMSGLMALCGEPQGRAQKLPVAFADVFTGVYASNAILGVLIARGKSGVGQFIDMALLDTMLAVSANYSSSYFATKKRPKRTGTQHPNISPYQTFPTQDAEFILAVGNDAQFVKFMEIIGLESWANHEKFATNKARIINRPELTQLMESKTITMTRDDILTKCEDAGVPAGPILNIDEAMNLPQVAARDCIFSAKIDEENSMEYIKSPIRYAEIPMVYDKAAPRLDEHRDEILKLIGR